jgi:uncharacterized protein with FMN-binding domain
MKRDFFVHLLRLLTILLMLAVVAVKRDGRLWGNDLAAGSKAEEGIQIESVVEQADGSLLVNTSAIAKDVQGYGGPTPLQIQVKDGVVVDVQALKNNESPDFFDRAFNHLLPKWKGQKVDDILAQAPDGVSGATMSSHALIQNMQRALNEVRASENPTAEKGGASAWAWSKIAVLIVVALGCILPLYARWRRYRTAWLCINVVVLGFWGGTFLSHALFVNWFSNGANLVASSAIVLMLVAAFVYPFFGKKNYYCTWLCPMGAMQDLAGKLNKRNKWHMSPTAVRVLTRFNEYLWAALMLLMLTGVWSDWMDYELFTAFLFQAASPVVIAAAALFVILSFFIPRPYCRFVCPTGCAFRLIQSGK